MMTQRLHVISGVELMEMEAEENMMRVFDSPDPGGVVVVDRSDHEPEDRPRCRICFCMIPVRRLQRFPHTALCGREACKLAHVRRKHTEVQRKYTLRRNMKKRDEELQKIDLRMSELQQRINTIIGHEDPPGYEGPPGPRIGKQPPEVAALVNEWTALGIRRAEIVAEGEEEARLADEHNRTQKQDCP